MIFNLISNETIITKMIFEVLTLIAAVVRNPIAQVRGLH